MLEPSELVQRSLQTGTGTFWQPGVYHSPLPEDIAPWYANVIGGGHSILCVLPSHWEEGMDDEDIIDSLVPVPVKSVLRGYEIRGEVVVPTSSLLTYDAILGLRTPMEDDE